MRRKKKFKEKKVNRKQLKFIKYKEIYSGCNGLNEIQKPKKFCKSDSKSILKTNTVYI